MKMISLDKIKIDGETQPRAFINESIVAEYAEQMEAGAKFPPVNVIFDGTNYWLWDGFHRWHARRKLGKKMIAVETTKGTREDAQWRSFGANTGHGLRRTNEDKERAVKAALQHPRAIKKQLGDEEIAEHCGVTPPTVAKYRKEMATTLKSLESPIRTGRDGRTIDTTKIGKKKRKKYGGIAPDAYTPVREHGKPEARRVSMELPTDNPEAAVATLISFFDKPFLCAVVKGLTAYLQGEEE